MQKKIIVAKSVLLATLLINGCSGGTVDREEKFDKVVNDEIISTIDNTEENNTQIITQIETNTTEDNTTLGNIDTNSSTVVEINADNAYRLDLKLSQEKYLSNSIGEIHYDLKNIYTNQIASSSVIEKITLTTNKDYAKFIKFDGQEGDTITISKDNVKASSDIALKTVGKSGTTNITVTATILLASGETKDLSTSIPLVIEKNVGSSMAIVPVGTRYENNLFVDKFVIHVVDQYGNKAKDGTRVSLGVINNPKLYTNAYNGNNDKANIKTTKELEIPTLDLSKITTDDKVVVLANENKNDPTILGGWSILDTDAGIDVEGKKLKLFDDYSGKDENGVSFVIGNESRYNSCAQTMANAAIYTPSGTEVKDGIVTAELRYVPYMVGKTVFVYANSKIDNKRIGISRRVNLTGLGLNPITFTCDNSNATAPKPCSQQLFMTLKGSNTAAKFVNLGSPICISGCADSWGATATDLTCNSWTTASFTVDINKSATYSFGDLIAGERILNQ